MPKTKPTKKKSRNRASRTKTAPRKKPVRRKKARSGERGRRPSGRIRTQSKLTQAAVAIGSALGKADRAAHKAASIVKEEAVAISDQVKDALS